METTNYTLTDRPKNLFEFKGRWYSWNELQSMSDDELDALRRKIAQIQLQKPERLDYYVMMQISVYNLITNVWLERKLK